ncbi:MAG TPA: ABC transporter ATP-binding protein [Candidatus Acidoferrales bacterium]|nr:ABC transporter ATP-binding protein [Candidatus Acidoferrales bacterium]
MIIETHDLVKMYRRSVAVDGLNLAVPEGSITGFLGPNGSGKTTTIKMLLGLVRPTSGEGFVFSEPIAEDRASVAIRSRTAYVSEDKRLYSYMTARQILDFTRPLYPNWSRRRERELLLRFNLPLDRKFSGFSKGMRTKLALVLALARSAPLLILDEPSEGLDPIATEHMLVAVIQAAAEGATVFFSTHQISQVERVADRVIILQSGRLVLEGSLEDLRARYRRIHLAFPMRAPVEEMQLDGVCKASSQGHVVSLLADGHLEEITGHAHAMGAISVTVEPVGLRELFLESVDEPCSTGVPACVEVEEEPHDLSSHDPS